ncbi:hypothetical protein ACQE98_00830 [Ornithinimicrobium sp. W1679]|uniref:hypothetical protein n=1 Tax=Ornithinimicrobium sp. W1679 TaxID=3418770 RepID=UPI003CE83C09
MSTAPGTTEVVVDERPVSTAWTVARWATLVAFVATVLVLVLTGTREASYADLQRGLQDGSVTQVRVEGALEEFPGAGDQFHGVTTVRLVWERGWETRDTSVRQASSQEEVEGRSLGGRHSAVVVGPIADELSRYSPDVEITYAEPDRGGTWWGPWRTPTGLVAVLPAVVAVLWLLVLSAGPEPRHATRFAWFWLALTPLVLVVVPAYLVLGARGALPGRRRLTGGWALLLLLVLKGAQEG